MDSFDLAKASWLKHASIFIALHYLSIFGFNTQNQEQNLLYLHPGTELLNVKVMQKVADFAENLFT